MNRRFATILLHRMYKLLRDKDMDIRSKIDREFTHVAEARLDGLVTLGVRKNNGGLIGSIIHELLHFLGGDAKEAVILKREKDVYEALSDRQLLNLLKRFFHR